MTAPKFDTLSVEFVSDLDATLTRSFKAPLELVYQAFVDPDLIPNWWGSRGSKVEVTALDLKPGGEWRYLITEQDGSEHGFRGQYQEIVPNTKLSYSFEYEPMPGQLVQITDLFAEQNGATTVIEHLVFDSREHRDDTFQSGMEAGAAESYDRLEEMLATLD